MGVNFDIDDMLISGKTPPQDELLPADFRLRFKLGKIHQLGLAVPNVVTSADRLSHVGLGHFLIAEDDLDYWIEDEQKKFFHGKMGLGYFGGYEIELLEAGKGSTFYSRKFREDGKVALHHIGFLTHSIDERVVEMNKQGIKTAVRGRIKLYPLTIDFAYMDSEQQAGIIVEFIEHRLLGIPIKPAEGLIKNTAKFLNALSMRQVRMGQF